MIFLLGYLLLPHGGGELSLGHEYGRFRIVSS